MTTYTSDKLIKNIKIEESMNENIPEARSRQIHEQWKYMGTYNKMELVCNDFRSKPWIWEAELEYWVSFVK